MVGHEVGLRRVSVVTPQTSERATGIDSGLSSHNSARSLSSWQRVQALLEEVSALVGRGAYRSDDAGGVLLDAVIDDIRCLLIEHQPARFIALSPREQQVAKMVACGRTNQAIASSLEISIWTVSTHLRRIFAKLAVSSRAEMVAHLLADPDLAYAVDRGFH
jgi:DNA-binding NarL/FixJ family response regulator